MTWVPGIGKVANPTPGEPMLARDMVVGEVYIGSGDGPYGLEDVSFTLVKREEGGTPGIDEERDLITTHVKVHDKLWTNIVFTPYDLVFKP